MRERDSLPLNSGSTRTEAMWMWRGSMTAASSYGADALFLVVAQGEVFQASADRSL